MEWGCLIAVDGMMVVALIAIVMVEMVKVVVMTVVVMVIVMVEVTVGGNDGGVSLVCWWWCSE